ncbi:MAG: hypothetical protein ABH952_05080 [Candidatus Omnitrophota bacterium]
MQENDKYKKAIERNLFEITHALLEYKALAAFDKYRINKHVATKGENFFTISFRALHNDMIAHAIKVLDKNVDSATFWHIFDKDTKTIEELENFSQEKLKILNDLAEKLKILRDKTHFHIDKNGVLEPDKVWERADIKGKDLGEGLVFLFSILNELYRKVFGKEFLFRLEDYDEKDLGKLLDIAGSNELIEVVPRVGIPHD